MVPDCSKSITQNSTLPHPAILRLSPQPKLLRVYKSSSTIRQPPLLPSRHNRNLRKKITRIGEGIGASGRGRDHHRSRRTANPGGTADVQGRQAVTTQAGRVASGEVRVERSALHRWE